MSLSLYKKKREFSKTPEPEGRKKSSKKELLFVIQKHAASHLHYDFRLELDGVLKSWAVPKGPSMNPGDKRLAMMVEDHPYDYRTFEGIIPEGNYGAGTVMVWDEGTYIAMDAENATRGEQEKMLLRQLRRGNLKIVLKGKKVKGSFALVRLKKDEKSWLLIKKEDEFSTARDITKKDKSVVTERTLDQIAKDKKSSVYGSNRKAGVKSNAKKTVTTKRKTQKATKKKASDIKELLGEFKKELKKSAMPANVSPMMATLVEDPFDDEDWIFEIKWDGYRAIASMKGKFIDIRSRNNLSFKEKYSPIAGALKEWGISAVVDGEIVALDDKGMPQFQFLQSWQKSGEGSLVYYMFDILWLEGYDLTTLTLVHRKRILKELIPESSVLKYSDHIEQNGNSFFEAASRKGIEGIIAKKAASTYQVNFRSKEWLKIKTTQRQEVVITGFTEGRASRKHFGALILGVYEGDALKYAGHTGSGFNEKSLNEIWRKLKTLVTDKSPFATQPKTNMPATWVKPQLVCEIKFQEWTKDNLMRQPIFMGLRTDKKAKDVKREKPLNTEKVKKKAEAVSSKPARKAVAKKPASKKTVAAKAVKAHLKKPVKKAATRKELVSSDEKEKIVKLDGVELKFTNLDKLYWKKEKYSKGDMLNYYHRIAHFILPYLKDHPLSLNRHPNGVGGMSFYQKDVKGKVPGWVTTHPNYSESTNETIDYFVCTNEASLLYMANLGCIEINPWHSRTQSPDNPDHCLIDLDPHEIGFEKVIETARVVKKVLDELDVPGYCKTSGASGIHIYIPLGAKYNYDQSKQLAELIVTLVHHEIPAFTSLERSPAKRRRKVYLDYLQNRQGQTVAAPYSLRPKPGATVSTPLHWEEVRKGLSPSQFTMLNIFDRLEDEGDIFTPVLQKGINIEKTLKKIESYLAVPR